MSNDSDRNTNDLLELTPEDMEILEAFNARRNREVVRQQEIAEAESPPSDDQYDQMPYDVWLTINTLSSLFEHLGSFTKSSDIFDKWDKLESVYDKALLEFVDSGTQGDPRTIRNWPELPQETRGIWLGLSRARFDCLGLHAAFRLLSYASYATQTVSPDSYTDPVYSEWAREVAKAIENAGEMKSREKALHDLMQTFLNLEGNDGFFAMADPQLREIAFDAESRRVHEKRELLLFVAIERYFQQIEQIAETYKDRYSRGENTVRIIDVGTGTVSRSKWGLGTSQEYQEMHLALSHAPSRRGYIDAQDGGFMHRLEGSAYFSKWTVTDEVDSLNALNALNRETAKRLRDLMDADSMLAFNYVQGLFVEDEPLPLNTRRSIWVNLDDIWKSIGWQSRSSEERLAFRQRIYSMLLYVHHAEVYGSRSKAFYDDAKKEIPTVISSSPWQIGDKQWPLSQPQMMNLFQSEPPVRVELTQSREWTEICENIYTKQVMEGCEAVGQIPGNQPGGAWARVIFVRALQQWKIDPKHEFKVPPTRRDFIDTYPPKKAPLSELLAGKDPLRIIKYWREALAILVELQLISPTEETNAQRPSGNKWANGWLDTPLRILPGERIRGYVETKAANKPALPTRRIPGPKTGRQRRRGN